MTNKDEEFTLIELLVVIGIIVALAAVTVPLVTKFAGKGDEGTLLFKTSHGANMFFFDTPSYRGEFMSSHRSVLDYSIVEPSSADA